jgi:hypothetical protein
MCVCAVLFASTHASATLIIDDFSCGDQTGTGQQLVVTSSSTTASSTQTVNMTCVLGQKRQMDLTWDSDGAPADATAYVDATTDMELKYSNDTGIQSHLLLTYDGMNDFDLTEGGGSVAIEVVLDYIDLEAKIEVTVYDDDGSSDTVVRQSTGSSAQTFLYPYAAFDSSVDFTMVDKLEFLLTDTDDTNLGPEGDSIDYEVTEIRTYIPEPLTMLGMFLGLGSIGAYVRRRRMF